MMKQTKKPAPVNGHVKKYFGGSLEIVDAKKPLWLMPSWNDFLNAVRFDAEHCGFANTAARLLGATKILFFKKAVYVDHVGEDGIRRIYRYIPSPAVTKTIKDFDDEKLDEKQVIRAFELRPPPFSLTLVGMRRQNRKWSRTDAGRAIEVARKSESRVKVLCRDVENTKEKLARIINRSPTAPSAGEAKKQLSNLRKQLAAAVDDARDKKQIAEKLRTNPYRPANKPQPIQRKGGHTRDGRFFWQPTKAAHVNA